MGRLLVLVVVLGVLMGMMRLLWRLDVVVDMGLDLGLEVEVLALDRMVAQALNLMELLRLQMVVQVMGIRMERIARVYCCSAVIVFC